MNLWFAFWPGQKHFKVCSHGRPQASNLFTCIGHVMFSKTELWLKKIIIFTWSKPAHLKSYVHLQKEKRCKPMQSTKSLRTDKTYCCNSGYLKSYPSSSRQLWLLHNFIKLALRQTFGEKAISSLPWIIACSQTLWIKNLDGVLRLHIWSVTTYSRISSTFWKKCGKTGVVPYSQLPNG